IVLLSCFFFQAEDGIRDFHVTGVQTCALPISRPTGARHPSRPGRSAPLSPHEVGGRALGRAAKPGGTARAGLSSRVGMGVRFFLTTCVEGAWTRWRTDRWSTR